MSSHGWPADEFVQLGKQEIELLKYDIWLRLINPDASEVGRNRWRRLRSSGFTQRRQSERPHYSVYLQSMSSLKRAYRLVRHRTKVAIGAVRAEIVPQVQKKLLEFLYIAAGHPL